MDAVPDAAAAAVAGDGKENPAAASLSLFWADFDEEEDEDRRFLIVLKLKRDELGDRGLGEPAGAARVPVLAVPLVSLSLLSFFAPPVVCDELRDLWKIGIERVRAGWVRKTVTVGG